MSIHSPSCLSSGGKAVFAGITYGGGIHAVKGRLRLKNDKHLLKLTVLCVLIFQYSIYASATATQIIELSLTEVLEPISTLRVFDGVSIESPSVSFPLSHSGEHTVSEAGGRAEKTPLLFTDIEVEEGGYLQYTLEGNSRNQKITVHCPTSGYLPGTLWVLVDPPGNAGSNLTVPDSLGSSVVGNAVGNDGKSGYIPVPAGDAPEDVILDIHGGKAWTDGKKNGAKLVYCLSDDPGVTSLQVVYSLVSE